MKLILVTNNHFLEINKVIKGLKEVLQYFLQKNKSKSPKKSPLKFWIKRGKSEDKPDKVSRRIGVIGVVVLSINSKCIKLVNIKNDMLVINGHCYE